eukprot:8363662-Alexandrium_andersonii.AAC.1
MLRLRRALLLQHAPKHWVPRQAPTTEQIPRPYATHKGKCLQVARPGLRCTKSHAHEREIVAGPIRPGKQWLRACA